MRGSPPSGRKQRLIALLLALVLLLSGCVFPGTRTQRTVSWLDLFDTVTTVIGFETSEAGFDARAASIREQLLRYHRLFDIYTDYEGINNLKTVNDQAGIAPVKVDPDIIRLLLDCREYYDLTGKKVNAAMGSVLSLWHEARSAGLQDPQSAQLPDPEALKAAAAHCSFDAVLIDEAESTVFIRDPEVSLDVGAIAKGWAAQRVAEAAPAGMLISIGGNVCATGPKPGKRPWIIGIQNPDGSGYLRTLSITGGAVVTSGDYQRTYLAEGKSWHHIIDPDTLMPSTLWRSVTVVCADAALADALSTALFLLPLEEGWALAEDCGAQAFWLDPQGQEFMTDSFRELL